MASQIKTAAQKLYCEDRQNRQQLNYYEVEAGEKVTLLAGNGFHTVVTPMRMRDDQFLADDALGDVPEADMRAARERLERSGYGIRTEAVYGPLFTA